MYTKSEIQAALTKEFLVGTSYALHSEVYGELIIVSTGVAGNLVLYKNFYPVAYIRPENLTAVLNAEEPSPPNEGFDKLQQLIKETCAEIIEYDNMDDFFWYVDDSQTKDTDFNRYKRTIPEGYTKAYKSEIQDALTKNFPVGASYALGNEHYGKIIIVSTGIAGNLILQHGFYPIAYIRPLTLAAIVNDEEVESGQFVNLRKLLKQTCAVVRKTSIGELVRFVDTKRDFGK